jgi:membrane-associated phospholipid phosphatase
LRNANADDFMIPITMMAERPVVWIMGLAMAFWLLLWRGWRVALLLLAIMGFAEFISINLNKLVAGPHSIQTGSFISTPTLMAGLVFGFLAALAGHSMGRWSKALVAAICGSIVVAIAFSRLYLGAELLSGVLAGGLLALVLTSLFGMTIEAIPARRIRPLGFVGFASLVFIATGYFHYSTNNEKAETLYVAKPTVASFSEAEWSAGAWSNIPSRRVDLAGTPEEVFAAQWVGNLAQLESAMAQQSWKLVPVWRWQDSFFYLDAKARLDKLPPRPVLHKGLKAKLTMVLDEHAATPRRLVLRAFKAHVNIQSDGRSEPVYLVSITPEVPKSRFHLYSIPATLKAEDMDFAAATAAIDGITNIRLLAHSDDPQKPGKVLLAKP